MAQAAHGALEAGIKFGSKDLSEPASIIIIGVKNQSQLEKAFKHLQENGIKAEMFFEPSWEYGNTAFGTEPIGEDLRHHLRRYQLWKP
jgi:hypothetical protein